ncbi:MAG: FAD-dependent monooxygenase [Pseudomonadota bacterium]
MDKRFYDLCVSGAGIAGMVAAIAFARLGHHVLLVDPNRPQIKSNSKAADLRSTAFLQPAIQFLDQIGVWTDLKEISTPLEIMRLADAGGAENTIRHVADFDASELGQTSFGWNIQNTALKAVLMQAIETLPTLETQFGSTLEITTARSDEVVLSLDGQSIKTRAVFVAEGRNSPSRERLGIPVKATDYRQSALAFAITHEKPHQNISTEIHRSGGPFTLVPMRDRDNMPCSSVVWMERQKEADRLLNLDDQAFDKALNDRAAGSLGQLTCVTPRQRFPIISQIAERLGHSNCYLIAEAAHVVPPIGAQGLNMSLADIQWLFDHVEYVMNGDQTKAYHDARISDMRLRIRGIDALNRAAMTDDQRLRNLRLAGLKALHAIAPIRQAVMKKGLGL